MHKEIAALTDSNDGEPNSVFATRWKPRAFVECVGCTGKTAPCPHQLARRAVRYIGILHGYVVSVGIGFRSGHTNCCLTP